MVHVVILKPVTLLQFNSWLSAISLQNFILQNHDSDACRYRLDRGREEVTIPIVDDGGGEGFLRNRLKPGSPEVHASGQVGTFGR